MMDVHIQSVSDWLSQSIFENRPVAEQRLLMQPLDGSTPTSLECALVWDQCHDELQEILENFSDAMGKAWSEAGSSGNSSSYDRWLDMWVSSPVSTRLLHALQTLMDGCIFQVRHQWEGLTRLRLFQLFFHTLASFNLVFPVPVH